MILAVSTTLLALPATASVLYEETISKEFSVDEFVVYTGDGISNVAFGYADYLAPVGASTAISIPSGARGSAFAFVCYHGITGVSASSDVIENGVISCEAILNCNMATKSQHIARRISDDYTVWDYYFVDPDHDEDRTEYR